jgi:hypothetical protein
MIKPQNQEAIDYIFSPEKQRTEKTVAMYDPEIML